jgi:hypothetical protein
MQFHSSKIAYAIVAGLVLSLQPAPSIAHATAKTTSAPKCSEKCNGGRSRGYRHHSKDQERAADSPQREERRRLIEEGRRLDSNPNADACLSYDGDYIVESKACP